MINMSYTRRETLSGLAVMAGLVGLAGCEIDRHPSYKFKYTLKVEETGGRQLSGSSVVKVSPVTTYGLGSNYTEHLKGEAAWVQLSDGRLVLALLEGPRAPDYRPSWASGPTRLLMHLHGLEWEPENADQLLARQGITRQLIAEQMPYVIVYNDVKDPESYQRVDVEAPSATLGAGVKSVSIAVQITDEPASHSIKSKLPWLKDKSIYSSQGPRAGMHLSVGRRWVIAD